MLNTYAAEPTKKNVYVHVEGIMYVHVRKCACAYACMCVSVCVHVRISLGVVPLQIWTLQREPNHTRDNITPRREVRKHAYELSRPYKRMMCC